MLLSSDSSERTDYGKITIESEKDNTKYHFSTIDSNGYVTKIQTDLIQEDISGLEVVGDAKFNN